MVIVILILILLLLLILILKYALLCNNKVHRYIYLKCFSVFIDVPVINSANACVACNTEFPLVFRPQLRAIKVY